MIDYQNITTLFGDCIVAERLFDANNEEVSKIILLEFIADGGIEEIVKTLQKRYPDEELRDVSDIVLYPYKKRYSFDDFFDTNLISWDNLEVNGNDFQIQVWKTLFEVPFGEIISYEELAKRAGYSEAIRAVATVVGLNPISLIIPCHRIVRKEVFSIPKGKKVKDYGNYRWGRDVKRQLIEWESGASCFCYAIDKIRKELFAEAKKSYKAFSQGLVPTNDNVMLGVKIPSLKTIAKKIVLEDWRGFLNYYNLPSIEKPYYEEILLQGMVINYAKVDLSQRLELIKNFIPKIDNWAVCDITCCAAKWTLKAKEEVWVFLQCYLKSDKVFEIRFGIIMLLAHYLDRDYINSVLEVLNDVKYVQRKDSPSPDNYYVEMAVAWLLATAVAKFRDEAFEYIKKNTLSSSVLKKTAQKMRDSLRVSDEDKKLIAEIINNIN